MNKAVMRDAIESERLVLFPYTAENLALFNEDLLAFEEKYGVVYRGEELDYLLAGFLHKLEREIAEDPENYLFFTEFLIVLKENSHVIGSIDYKYVPRDGVTELGYGMNPSYTGHGYMTEALKAFLKLGRELGIRTVLADTLPDNVKSQNVLKRCGFEFLKEEGNLWWKYRMDGIRLVKPTSEYAEQIEEYRREFPEGRMRVTYNPERIPGMDHLEDYESVLQWLEYCSSMEGKISWYMAVRNSDGKIVGFSCLRHSLAYDDDDPAFASHIGCSVRPGERRKGYAREQLRLMLDKAREAGLESVRIVCRDINIGSSRAVMANGGVFVDSIHGELSGLTINRYDIRLN